jgi:hypothetical protein
MQNIAVVGLDVHKGDHSSLDRRLAERVGGRGWLVERLRRGGREVPMCCEVGACGCGRAVAALPTHVNPCGPFATGRVRLTFGQSLLGTFEHGP